jgi:cyclase
MPLTRRSFLIMSSAAVSALPFRSLALGQPAAAPSAPPVRFDLIRRHVGFFTGRGGTIGWLIDPDAVVVVDTQFPDTATLCLEGLKERSTRGTDLVFNTHHHGDHTGGNGVFKEAAKGIVAHARVPELLKQQAAQNPNAPAPVLPTSTFETTWRADMGDEQITATHHGPGHTGGDIVVHFERAQVAHMGDLLFHERHPYIDRPSGADIQNWIATLETVANAMDRETQYIAGHAGQNHPVIVGRAALLRQRDYFDAALSHVRKGIADGRSREEIVALPALKGFEAHQGSPPRLTLASTLGAAYEELHDK